jgi:thioredoxin 1
LLFAQPGVVPAAALDQLIGKARELDMDAVRRDIDAHERAQAHQEAKKQEESR